MNEYVLKEEKKWSQITFFEDSDDLTKLEIVKKTYFISIGFFIITYRANNKGNGPEFCLAQNLKTDYF